MINLKLFIVIFLITLVICQLVHTALSKRNDGKLIVDETADSWTISITTSPEEIKRKKKIRLDVELTSKYKETNNKNKL